jgi:hypothetical protein
MNLFESVKEAVPMRAAAEHFGIRVGRGGMACCPFHNDRTPSMKLNEDYFYCFGCGATGDVIDFVARLFNLSPKEAAEKLAADGHLSGDSFLNCNAIRNLNVAATVCYVSIGICWQTGVSDTHQGRRMPSGTRCTARRCKKRTISSISWTKFF